MSHNINMRNPALTSLVHPSVINYCQSSGAGIYSVPSLAPLTNKVSQVEMEAGDCEGRLPPLFLKRGLGPLVFGLLQECTYDIATRDDGRKPKTQGQKPKTRFYEHRHHG